jgi:hypothetical protein
VEYVAGVQLSAHQVSHWLLLLQCVVAAEACAEILLER